MVEIGRSEESSCDGALWSGAFVGIGAILHEEARHEARALREDLDT
jgi:hypothetical protein